MSEWKARRFWKASAVRPAGQGFEVLLDDRPKVSPGVKFKDAELLGMPFIVILGRAFADGNVELRIRGGETLEVPAGEIVATRGGGVLLDELTRAAADR